MRLCLLLPSATEIVAAVGLADSLVARSAECDWPPEVRPLPVVTAARIDTSEMASFEIVRHDGLVLFTARTIVKIYARSRRGSPRRPGTTFARWARR